MPKNPDCPHCGETLRTLGDEAREFVYAPHADFICMNRDCDEVGTTFTARQVKKHYENLLHEQSDNRMRD